MASPTKTPQAGKGAVIVTIYSIDNAIVVDPPRPATRQSSYYDSLTSLSAVCRMIERV
jgi:flagellar hook-associated protein FlgK